MTTLDIPAAGYSICYELGIFRQRIVDGQQVELPDNWKDIGGAWLMPKPQETEEVLFGGTIRKFWDNGRLHVVPEGATKVLAVPCDMEITGYGTEHVNLLRLWDAKSPTPVDMSLFSQGEYLRARAGGDGGDHRQDPLSRGTTTMRGKSLRLKQQYFFVSATMQSIMRKHIEVYGTAANFHEKNVIQINDTHPALVIPELMRILMDDAGFDWDTRGISQKFRRLTNHTVLAEALEPGRRAHGDAAPARVWEIITEIAHRYQEKVENFYHDPPKRAERPSSGTDRCVWRTCASRAAWRSTAFPPCTPTSCATTYSIAVPDGAGEVQERHQRHRPPPLARADQPRLDGLMRRLLRWRGYLLHPRAQEVRGLRRRWRGARAARRIKRANKLDFAVTSRKTQGVALNTDAIFDVQVKRLHEYKRQLLNAMHII